MSCIKSWGGILPLGPTLASKEWSCTISSSLSVDSWLAVTRIWNNIPVPPLEINTPTLRPLPKTENNTSEKHVMWHKRQLGAWKQQWLEMLHDQSQTNVHRRPIWHSTEAQTTASIHCSVFWVWVTHLQYPQCLCNRLRVWLTYSLYVVDLFTQHSRHSHGGHL